jgi:hypothetical protein
VGYNGRVFSAVGYNEEGFPPLWDTTEEDFFCCGIQQRTISGWQTNFFLLYPTTWEIFLPLYPTPQQNLMQCTVTQKNLPHCIPQCCRFSSVVSYNGRYFHPLWDTTEEVFFVVGYNELSFPPLWDKTEEVFFYFGIQRKRFFSVVGYNGKNYTTQNDVFTF